ncbi:hypothetical protein [Bdellovibrio bacteriovorus]|uniref:Uncharacterized protein n=1 Tax=Bdellovibrio bacteriovorus TaxID=959 RepID=A0A150WCN2_BDEBC|nr:hypothetical protein [Bdellovibrio bacteriovorus]KYG60736.1 hypothetical protein AZI85_12135 [Bdellovibrio bacteriovorus]KYG69061.1 hypothetical protein AZI87_07520 [Bdellovibrio bacteriovorus]
MEELKFVAKCLCFTMLLIMLMQVKIGGASIEYHSFRWLQRSTVSEYVQSAAAGGAMAIRNLGRTLKDGVASTVDGFQEGAHEKAVR